MSLSPTVIYLLHSADISPQSTAAQKAHTWLSYTERERMSRFKIPRAQHTYLLGRALLRGLLSQHCNTPPERLQFALADGGKPYLQGDTSGIHFNLSHSGQWLALAVSTHSPVGVDIEHPQKPRDFISIARHYFHRKEYHALKTLHGQALQDAFYKLWTLKEAFFKARGTGISEGLARIRFDDNNASITAIIDPELLTENSHWQFHYWRPPQDLSTQYHLACANTQTQAPLVKRILSVY